MIRKAILSGSWYPGNSEETEHLVLQWTENIGPCGGCFSGVVPHAGWFYSGKTASEVIKKLCPGFELYIVIGGHIPPGGPVLAAYEDQFETPAGLIVNRTDLLDDLEGTIKLKEDIYNDNTVEVVLPFIKVLSPSAEIMWLRAPADENSVLLGEAVYHLVEDKKISAAVIGSTDLTHYGRNYGFSPAGGGANGREWANKNDKEIIELLLDFRYEEALSHADRNKSACSVGAAVAAARFAELKKSGNGRLLSHNTSYDTTPSDSFVGYAGIIY